MTDTTKADEINKYFCARVYPGRCWHEWDNIGRNCKHCGSIYSYHLNPSFIVWGQPFGDWLAWAVKQESFADLINEQHEYTKGLWEVAKQTTPALVEDYYDYLMEVGS